MTLPDPEHCRVCNVRGFVIDSRKPDGYRRKRRECPKCGRRWNSFESVVNPAKLSEEELLEAMDRGLVEYEYVESPPSRHWPGLNRFEREKFYKTDEWLKAKAAVLQRAGSNCEHCGVSREVVARERRRFHIHHIVPWTVPETRSDPSNLILLCQDCHRFVHSRANTGRLYLPPSTSP
jgi:hypothetical protein